MNLKLKYLTSRRRGEVRTRNILEQVPKVIDRLHNRSSLESRLNIRKDKIIWLLNNMVTKTKFAVNWRNVTMSILWRLLLFLYRRKFNAIFNKDHNLLVVSSMTTYTVEVLNLNISFVDCWYKWHLTHSKVNIFNE